MQILARNLNCWISVILILILQTVFLKMNIYYLHMSFEIRMRQYFGFDKWENWIKIHI